MFDFMGKIQEAQKQMEETKKRLSDIIVEEQAEGGKINVKANCEPSITNIEISEELYKNSDKGELEDLLIVTINKALIKAKETQEIEMSKVAKGMLPGGFGGLFGK
jgi:nucleoid-associated protein EbfC